VRQPNPKSLADYREQEDMINVPLYAIGPWAKWAVAQD
jgi:hypothetical protein